MKRFLLVALLGIFVALLLSCSKTENKTVPDNTGTVSTQAASETSSPTFATPDLDGNIHTLSEYKGKSPLVLNFWGTWCPPCRAELPDLKKIYADYGPKGVIFVGLATRDTPESVRKFAADNGMDWTMLLANQDALISFQISGVPTTIFYDRNGVERGRLIGMSSYDQFKAQMDKIL
ncbi:putative Thiol-disulfide oxidoreductase ResA [Candidatus Zixiibacteriota bacterium]|nr:putative Thiol-disulfide oxidoreductase ResA [candidate division Zixibacteria bacterium]